ncbi:hypothetical protein AMK16_25520 [Streptomyces sp. CB00455]|uniref:hypothetical protein n=1 Tax=Streptomyces sp. CB00455 TaxID=1703927 RepID=UPI00093D4070|nr:hypothetical protein [Streptomyces sp. CB00455]OKK16085.1 hypothetical protein AMK16_25520 [Streptomyces sp. CB00455]
MTAHDVARALPDVPVLRDLCRSMAMVEAVLNPDGERYYSFSATRSQTEETASMRNGAGDEFDIVFCEAGAYLRGFDHESPMSPYVNDVPWPGVVDSVPEVFQGCVEEPAFTDDGVPRVTACIWREAGSERWQAGEIDFPEGHADPDGSGWLFQLLLDPAPEAFQRFAEAYYETTVDIEAVREVYALRPLSRKTVRALNSTVPFATVADEAASIGYAIGVDLSA